MVDFIKRWYLLLEKALNAEYCLAQIGYTRPPESGKQDSEAEHDTEMSLSFSLMKGLPLLEPITAEKVYDNKPGCLELARLYNWMLRVVDDNAINVVKAHIGDPSSGFHLCNSMCQIETIYDGLQRILTCPKMSYAASVQAKVEKRNNTLSRGDMKAKVMRESTPGVEATMEDGVSENKLQPDVSKAEDSTAMHSKLNGSSEEAKDIEMAEVITG